MNRTCWYHWVIWFFSTIGLKCHVICKTRFPITKTCLYNFDSLNPHFCVVKLGFTGVYIVFLISAQNINCGYSLEPPRRGGSNEYPQSHVCFEQKYKKYQIFLSKNFHFLVVKFSVYLNRRVFVMHSKLLVWMFFYYSSWTDFVKARMLSYFWIVYFQKIPLSKYCDISFGGNLNESYFLWKLEKMCKFSIS